MVGRDPASDLALLRTENLNLPAVSASQGTQVGELLSVVGRGRGLQAALGFVGVMFPPSGRRGLMPTGATPFPGVSGGGVFDARGGLVGIAHAGFSRGELLAVPAERALKWRACLRGMAGCRAGIWASAPSRCTFLGTRPDRKVRLKKPGRPALNPPSPKRASLDTAHAGSVAPAVRSAVKAAAWTRRLERWRLEP